MPDTNPDIGAPPPAWASTRAGRSSTTASSKPTRVSSAATVPSMTRLSMGRPLVVVAGRSAGGAAALVHEPLDRGAQVGLGVDQELGRRDDGLACVLRPG